MRRLLFASAAFAVIMAMCAPAAQAAAPPTGVAGTVRDIVTHAPIAGAVVHASRSYTRTKSNGTYRFKMSAGAKTIYVTKAGYLKTYQVTAVTKGNLTQLDWALTRSYPTNAVPARPVTILAWNDLGMHCDQDSYKYGMVLPPYNTFHVQLFGGEGALEGGYSVSYAFAKKTDSTLNTDFWTYAPSFGWNLPPNVGLTGSGLAGQMQRDPNGPGYVVTGVPLTPYDDDGTWDPYGPATITVRNGGGAVVATSDVVVPVSTELSCGNCHGTDNPFADILGKHDALNGTTLLDDANAGHPHACSECHADNALGAAGQPGVESLSVAMHKRHDGKLPNTTDGCYNCHPGPKTQCLRGIMERAGKGCVDCHGTMTNVWTSASTGGRQPWLNEPKCSQCHDAKHAENPGTLYRNSVLRNSVAGDMNGRIYCEACHNSTHAEYQSANASDAVVPQAAQGNGYWIYNCQVCHKGGDSETRFKGQAMHR